MTQRPSFIDKLMTMFDEHRLKAVLRSYTLVMRDERKARLETVMELSVELAEIKKVTIQSSAFAESTIESVIEGDWDQAAKTVDLMLTFRDERHDPAFASRMNGLYEKFRAIVVAACGEAKRREAGQPSENN